MVFSSSKPQRPAMANTDSQYETTSGYSSSAYSKHPRSSARADIYATNNVITSNLLSRPYQSSRRRNQYLNEQISDVSNYQHLHTEHKDDQQFVEKSSKSPQRPVADYHSPLSNGTNTSNGRQRPRHSNWSSLGSLNSFGDSATTPPSSQDHTGSGGSNTGASGTSVQQRETLHSRFEFKQTLGKGTYGKVKLALDKRKNEQVAIKTIKKSRIENPHDLARIRREIDFMTSLNHPYIIRIKEVYESREKIILVMEYASGGELYDYLNRMKRIPESQARAIFRQIVSAVHFLHKNHIVHRDLKLENILIDHNGDIKLADFGLSNSWSPRRLLHTFCGSPLYASPEIVSGIPYYGPEVDCWSLGVLLYTLVYGSMPFQGGDYNRLVRNITSGDFIQPREQSGALSLIQFCLTPDANHRATTKDILRHDWLANGPVLSLRLNSKTASSLSLADQSPCERDKVHLRTPTSTKTTEKSASPANSLAELELHTSSFFDTARLREPNPLVNREQQRRHRSSAIADTANYYSTRNGQTNSTSQTRTGNRRPLSLSLENQDLPNPTDYHFALTSELITGTGKTTPSTSSQAYNRRSRRTMSPASNKTASTNYSNHDRLNSPPSSYRYSMATTPDSNVRRTISPLSPSRYVVSYDVDPTLQDLKRRSLYKYTPGASTAGGEINVVPSLSNSTTPVAPSVFTTSAIKFAPAPAPVRSTGSVKDQENTSTTGSSVNGSRPTNAIQTNPLFNLDDSQHFTTATNRRSLLTSVDIPSSVTTANNLRSSRLLDDNNNFISLKVHD